MASTLSYGYIQPANNDPGSVWFPALNDNITRLNDHNHDGVDSAPISAGLITSGSLTIASASWAADGTGRYKQTVTLPGGFSLDVNAVVFKLPNGTVVYPSFDRLSATSMTVYFIDNTITLTAVFR